MCNQVERLHYSMKIEWEPAGQVFVATVPELRGCMTHGKTYDEAVRQGQHAIESWRDARGAAIPDPRHYDPGEVTTPRPVTANVG